MFILLEPMLRITTYATRKQTPPIIVRARICRKLKDTIPENVTIKADIRLAIKGIISSASLRFLLSASLTEEAQGS